MRVNEAGQDKPAWKGFCRGYGPVMSRTRRINPPRPRLLAERKLDAVHRPRAHAVTLLDRAQVNSSGNSVAHAFAYVRVLHSLLVRPAQ